jgi:SSS family solute:Na+ symporter/sodium/proline symporter
MIALLSAVLLIAGGYMVTLKADFFQGIVMMFGVSALIVMVIISPQVGGLSNGVIKITEHMKENSLAPMNFNMTIALISTILMTSFGTWGLPQMIHKYYGIKDKKEVNRGIIISTFFSLLVAGGGYFIGSFSHVFFGNTLPQGGKDYIVPHMLNIASLPNILIGVVLVLLISASVSTLSSITLTACSSVSMDLIKTNINKNITDKNITMITKILCAVFVVFSFIIAYYPTPILEMMSYSWGVISGSFLAPYVIALYWKGINKAGAWCGMISGFLTSFVPAAISGFKTPDGPLYACIAIIVSIILCFAASIIARKLNLKSGRKNDLFYTASAEEFKKESF